MIIPFLKLEPSPMTNVARALGKSYRAGTLRIFGISPIVFFKIKGELVCGTL
jgi:hypothetical protein